MKKVIIVLALGLIFLPLSSCRADEQKTAYTQNVETLEKTCAELTEKDEEGHTYQAVVGRYLAGKSYTYAPPTHTGSETVGYRIFLDKDGEEFLIRTGVHIDQAEIIDQQILRVFGKNVIRDKSPVKTIVGICTHNSFENFNVGKIETFVKIGEQE